MKKIKIGEYLLDKQLALLQKSEFEVAVEPKLLELLLLFCEHPNRIISREYILEKIWQNTIVTDNAINKMVGNLRKLLSDDPKKPQYIQTVPKRGYRLICLVETLNTPHTESNEQTAVTPFENFRQYWLYWLAFIVVFIGGLSLSLLSKTKDIPFNIYNTHELTRQQGHEYSALHNDKGNFLLYLKQSDSSVINQLWRKDLSSNQAYLVATQDINIVKLISVADADSKKSAQVIFIGSKNHQCFIYRADWLSEKEITDIEPILDCSTMAILDVAYSKTPEQLIYTARKQQQSSKIYSYDIKTEQHFLMAQPEPLGIGNHSVDISPDGKKLLIMRSNADLHTQLFVLHLQSNELTSHQSFSYFVSEAMWHHDSEHILYFPPPPAHQILMSDLSGKNTHTIVSVSEYLSRNMSLIDDDKSVLFATNLQNYSNRWLTDFVNNDNLENRNRLLDNSNVYDMLPVLLNDDEHYLFISKRTGKSQLYYGNHLTGGSTVISQLSDYVVFRFISISPDQKHLLLATYNRIWKLPLAELIGGTVSITALDEYQILNGNDFIRALNWLSPAMISVTKEHDGKKRLSLINVENKNIYELDKRWSYAVSDTNKNEEVFLVSSHDNTLYQTTLSALQIEEPVSTKQTFIRTDHTLTHRFRDLKIHQQTLYFIDQSSRELKLIAVALKDQTAKTTYQIKRTHGYDVTKLGILLNELKSQEGDIHRTTPNN
ncbi:MAG: winged helix-turn-helix domain-containing protein [Colwellia sp.]|nr:winged helix-turn-helix domain-containing protein [Colwellia sp.]